MPMRTKVSPKRASVEPMTTSPANARFAPPPAAVPLTATISGCGRFHTCENQRWLL